MGYPVNTLAVALGIAYLIYAIRRGQIGELVGILGFASKGVTPKADNLSKALVIVDAYSSDGKSTDTKGKG